MMGKLVTGFWNEYVHYFVPKNRVKQNKAQFIQRRHVEAEIVNKPKWNHSDTDRSTAY